MKTSFGSLEPLTCNGKEVVSEMAIFYREGRSHSHCKWEICTVLCGKGKIISGEQEHIVEKGSIVSIPPRTGHWMIPEGEKQLKILITYSDKEL